MEKTALSTTETFLEPSKPGLPNYAYSENKVVPPFSFLDEKAFSHPKAETEKKDALTPCYIPLETLNVEKTFSPSSVFEDFSREKEGDLKITNKVLLK